MSSRLILHMRSIGVVGCVAGVAAFAACGTETTRPSTTDPAGVYFLHAIAGQGLPYSLPLGINLTIVQSGRLEFVSRDRLLDIETSNVHVVLTNIDLPVETDTFQHTYRIHGDTVFVEHAAFDTISAYTDTAIALGDTGIIVRVLQRIPDSTGLNFVYRPWLYDRNP